MLVSRPFRLNALGGELANRTPRFANSNHSRLGETLAVRRAGIALHFADPCLFRDRAISCVVQSWRVTGALQFSQHDENAYRTAQTIRTFVRDVRHVRPWRSEGLRTARTHPVGVSGLSGLASVFWSWSPLVMALSCMRFAQGRLGPWRADQGDRSDLPDTDQVVALGVVDRPSEGFLPGSSFGLLVAFGGIGAVEFGSDDLDVNRAHERAVAERALLASLLDQDIHQGPAQESQRLRPAVVRALRFAFAGFWCGPVDREGSDLIAVLVDPHVDNPHPEREFLAVGAAASFARAQPGFGDGPADALVAEQRQHDVDVALLRGSAARAGLDRLAEVVDPEHEGPGAGRQRAHDLHDLEAGGGVVLVAAFLVAG